MPAQSGLVGPESVHMAKAAHSLDHPNSAEFRADEL